MRIQDCMSTDVQIRGPDDSIRDVANVMRDCDCGLVPIAEDGRLVGVVTDRDIVVRGIANGLGPEEPARLAMSSEVLYCFEDQEIEEVTANMAELKIRRMPVVSRDKQLTGIVSLGDLAQGDGASGGAALRQISERGGPHSQAAA